MGPNRRLFRVDTYTASGAFVARAVVAAVCAEEAERIVSGWGPDGYPVFHGDTVTYEKVTRHEAEEIQP